MLATKQWKLFSPFVLRNVKSIIFIFNLPMFIFSVDYFDLYIIYVSLISLMVFVIFVMTFSPIIFTLPFKLKQN